MISRHRARIYLFSIFYTGIVLIFLSRFIEDSFSPIFSTITTNIGLALLTSGIIGFVFRYFQTEQTELLEETIQTISYKIEGNNSAALSGIERVYDSPSRALANYAEIVDRTKAHIEILSAAFSPFFWSPDFESATLKALKRGVRFRILLLDPNAKSLELLSKQEGREVEDLHAELRLAVRKWEDIAKSSGEHLSLIDVSYIEIRTYDGLPSAFIMVTDDILFFAPYINSKYRISLPCIQTKIGGSTFHSFKQHFESMWDQARETKVYKE